MQKSPELRLCCVKFSPSALILNQKAPEEKGNLGFRRRLFIKGLSSPAALNLFVIPFAGFWLALIAKNFFGINLMHNKFFPAQSAMLDNLVIYHFQLDEIKFPFLNACILFHRLSSSISPLPSSMFFWSFFSLKVLGTWIFSRVIGFSPV